MSYDLLAFDPAAVADGDFPAWWDEQSQWSEDHSYDDPDVTTPDLRSFYDELIQAFPPMNGPDAVTDEDLRRDPELESRMTDYSIGTSLVYGTFSWSQARTARAAFTMLAAKHGVAVALVSDDGSILRPQRTPAG
ncbi:hypothetical protein ACIGB8_01850 [Promicromonospora sukumoe]|uniref:hypothetical protein n=1 Tax=Promicromonospora sukumoe TaxID=88382 RepID=UPI0037CB901B